MLKDGKNAAELHSSDIRRNVMVRCMVGRDISGYYAHRSRRAGQPVLEIRRLRNAVWPDCEVSFTIREGEIVGLVGLVGAGRTALLRTLFGFELTTGGQVLVHGEHVKLNAPRDAMAAGVALVPEDRAQQELVLNMLVQHNLSLAALVRSSRKALCRRWEKDRCMDIMRRLRIDLQRLTSSCWTSLRVALMSEPSRRYTA